MTHNAAAVVLLALISLTASPNATAQESPTTTISLGEATAPPGSSATAPLTLSPGDGAEIGALTVRLTYPAALLQFEKAEPSGLALGVGAEVKANVEEGLGGKSSTLVVTISTGSPPAKALPAGPLAYIAFRVSERAEPESTIPLTHAAEVSRVGAPSGRVEPVTASPAAIRVAAPPVPACFFYMH